MTATLLQVVANPIAAEQIRLQGSTVAAHPWLGPILTYGAGAVGLFIAIWKFALLPFVRTSFGKRVIRAFLKVETEGAAPEARNRIYQGVSMAASVRNIEKALDTKNVEYGKQWDRIERMMSESNTHHQEQMHIQGEVLQEIRVMVEAIRNMGTYFNQIHAERARDMHEIKENQIRLSEYTRDNLPPVVRIWAQHSYRPPAAGG